VTLVVLICVTGLPTTPALSDLVLEEVDPGEGIIFTIDAAKIVTAFQNKQGVSGNSPNGEIGYSDFETSTRRQHGDDRYYSVGYCDLLNVDQQQAVRTLLLETEYEYLDNFGDTFCWQYGLCFNQEPYLVVVYLDTTCRNLRILYDDIRIMENATSHEEWKATFSVSKEWLRFFKEVFAEGEK
jgi:hypothetical protein